ncbi:MAG: hypothetical protein V4721_01930 [Bacteroidota bacterium]
MKNFKLVLLLAIILSGFNMQAQEKVKPPKAEKQYIIHERARQITRLEFWKDPRATANIVVIQTQSVTGGSATLLSGDVPTVEITSMEVVVGGYGTKREISRTGRAVLLELGNVAFPIRLRLTLADRPVLEFELKEPGTWNVSAGVTL